MLSKKYRLIEKGGLYRAQWSRLGLLWTDIGWDTYTGAYDADELGHFFLIEDRAKTAIEDHKRKAIERRKPWREVPL